MNAKELEMLVERYRLGESELFDEKVKGMHLLKKIYFFALEFSKKYGNIYS